MINIEHLNNSIENQNCSKTKIYQRLYYYHKLKNQPLEEALLTTIQKLNTKKLTELYEDPKDIKKIVNQRYYDKKKEQISQNCKNYYKENKIQISEQRKNAYQMSKKEIICPCGSKITNFTLELHIKSKKHIKFVEAQECATIIFLD